MQRCHLETPQEKRWLWLCGRRPDPTVNLLNLEKISGEWNIYLAYFTVTRSGWESESASPVCPRFNPLRMTMTWMTESPHKQKVQGSASWAIKERKIHLHCSRSSSFFSIIRGCLWGLRALCWISSVRKRFGTWTKNFVGSFVDGLKKNSKFPTEKLAVTGINYNTNGFNLITTKNSSTEIFLQLL